MSEDIAFKDDSTRSRLGPFLSSLTIHPHRDVDDEDQITAVVCLRRTAVRVILVILGGLLTVGFLWLFCLWYVKFRAWLMYRKCGPEDATHFMVSSSYSTEIISPKQKTSEMHGKVLTLTYRFLHYYVQGQEVFPFIFPSSRIYSEFHSEFGRGYTDEVTVKELRDAYGSCRLEVPEPGICSLLVSEILTPFILFQMYSIGLWCYEMYFWYAIAIFLLTTVSVIASLVETKRNIHRVRYLAGESFTVQVIRNGTKEEINSSQIVHGDLVVVPNHGKIPCDLLLISGGAIMKESMLTGESVPVIKDPLPDRGDFTYDIEKDKIYTIYQGTESLQATPAPGQQYVLAIAARTGFHTLKGKLIRSIMFPKPNRFRFARESMLFLLILVMMTIVGFLITLKPMLDSPLVTEDIVIRILDLITIAVPPLLPTAMAIGTVFAISRLKSQQIYCISPPRVNVCGEIRQMVFDKTGTLTEDGMTLCGVISGLDRGQRLVATPSLTEKSPLFLENLVCCHSLKIIDTAFIGDIMDIVIFQSTQWKYKDGNSEDARAVLISPDDSTRLKLVHLFHFDSIMKRMGVIVEGEGFRRFHVKGAPEIVSTLCNPATLPANLNQILDQYAQVGLRVLACASGPVPDSLTKETLETMNISDLEHNLQFLGIVVLQNKLKEESAGAIAMLKKAEIGCVMATGDASLTGLAISRECGIIPKGDEVYIGDVIDGKPVWNKFTFLGGQDAKDNDEGETKTLPNEATELSVVQNSIRITRDLNEAIWLSLLLQPGFSLVVTGKLFAALVQRAKDGTKKDQVVLRGCLEHTKVYARMSPEEKTLLVDHLKTTGVLVGMCGDGANDCGALKAADIGVSLSEAEASIAAPFTSKVQNITAVLIVLKEGRCALAASFMAFKYMALYSMTQFSSVCILFWWGSYLADFEFLFSDVFMVLPLTILMCYTKAYSELSIKTPGDSLLSLPVIFSVVGNGALCFASQVLAWGLASDESWFVTVDIESEFSEEGIKCVENSVVWLTSNFNYLIVVLVFNIGRPFRKEPYTNIAFMVWFLWMVAVSFCLMLDPPEWVRTLLTLIDLDRDFKGKLLGINFAYMTACVIYEKLIMWGIDWAYRRKKSKAFNRKKVESLTIGDE